MSYFEIKVLMSNEKSFFEGRYYVPTCDKFDAVKQVKKYLEIIDDTTNFEFYTREISYNSYSKKMANANEKCRLNNYYLDNLRGKYAIDGDFDENFTWDNIIKKVRSYDKLYNSKMIKQYETDTDIYSSKFPNINDKRQQRPI